MVVAVDAVELGERFTEFGLDATLTVDVDTGEQGLVEQAPLGVAALAVELVRPLE